MAERRRQIMPERRANGRTYWRTALGCFIAAGILALGNVALVKTVGVTAWTMPVHIAALWLIAPMAWWAIVRFTKSNRQPAAPVSEPDSWSGAAQYGDETPF